MTRWRGYLLSLALFGPGVVAANRLAHLTASGAAIPYWPLHIFHPRSPGIGDIFVALLALGLFLVAVWRMERTNYRSLAEVTAFGALLLLATNTTQGENFGFVHPIAGGSLQYYHDAQRHASDPGAFLRDFNQVQPSLGNHARTHPPGAVLLLELLRRLTGDNPALIAVLIAVGSAVGSGLAYRRLIARLLPGLPPNYAAFLLLLLPAVQIYYCASLDAVIATLLLAALACAAEGRRIGTTLCVLAASFLTFGFVWVLPPLIALERERTDWRQATLRILALTLLSLLAAYTALYFCAGFNYVAALHTATTLENPQGYRLLTDPGAFTISRLQAVGELAIFLGPFLLALLITGIQALRTRYAAAYRLLLAGVGALGAILLAGAYPVGETGRVCLFLYPLLLLPALAAYEERDRKALLILVFAQSLLMQLFGRYFW